MSIADKLIKAPPMPEPFMHHFPSGKWSYHRTQIERRDAQWRVIIAEREAGLIEDLRQHIEMLQAEQMANYEAGRREVALVAERDALRADLISSRGTVKTELYHYDRLARVHGKTPHGECYEAEACRLAALLDRIDALITQPPAAQQRDGFDTLPDDYEVN